ncbi:MAG TPA: GAF domain-containing protein [bacterium]
MLYKIVESLKSLPTAPELANKTYKLVSQVIPCDRFAIALDQPSSNELDFIFTVSNGKRYPRFRQKMEDRCLRDAISKKKVVISNKVNRAGHTLIRNIAKQNGAPLTRSLIVSPIFSYGKTVGVLCAESSRPGAYTPEDGKWLSVVCNQIGAVLSGTHESYSNGEEPALEIARKIGHEMNQPLTGIAAYCTFIMEQIDRANPIYNDVEQIAEQTKRLERLVFDFQSLASSDSPQTSSADSDFNLHK